MTESSAKWLLESMQALGGTYEFSDQSCTGSLLLEPQTSLLLGIPEYTFLDFNAEPSGGSVDIHQLEEKISAIATDRGATAAVRMDFGSDTSWPSQKKAEQFLSSSNGKVVFKEARVMDQSYLIIYSRCAAVSDEKRSFLAGAAINRSSLAIAPQMPLLLEMSMERMIRRSEPIHFTAYPDQQVKKRLSTMLQKTAEELLTDFKESMRKRMDRDSKRLYSYYNELFGAARTPARNRNTEPSVIKSNLDAIQSEYGKKIEDLQIKYLTALTIEPFCAVELVLPCLVSSFDVFMGSKSMGKSIAWNPLTLQSDKSICDCCHGPVESSHVCRNLHWLCSDCWKTCPSCKRDYCVLCKPNGCSCMQ